MKPVAAPFGYPLGLSAVIWLTAGILRYLSEHVPRQRTPHERHGNPLKPRHVAVVIAAHNEEAGILPTIHSLTGQIPASQVFVASDGSTDRTADLARSAGCRVSELNPGLGKARALKYLLQKHRLFDSYPIVFICDADTRVDPSFLNQGLRYFNDPEVSAVFAATKTYWPDRLFPGWKWFFVSYRDRLNRLLISFYLYGQTWKHTNNTYVIPGSCTLYRSCILEKLPIDTPGLLIEDFNTAFFLKKKRLGKVAFHPNLIQWEHYPDNLRDYCRQVFRWNIGYLQTVRMNGVWPSWFWVTQGIFLFEVWSGSFFTLLVPLLALLAALEEVPAIAASIPLLTSIYRQVGIEANVSLVFLGIGVFGWDYLMTILVAVQQRRPQYLLYGIGFFFMHYVTALILVASFLPGLSTYSDGRWKPPTRRQ